MAVPAGATVIAFGAVAAIAGLVAAVVGLADPQRQANRWLAAYLGLEAVSFAFVALGGVLRSTGLASAHVPSGRTWGAAASNLNVVFSVAGTASLVYLASVFPRHRGVRTSRLGAALLVLAAGGLLAAESLAGWVSTSAGPLDPGSLASSAYVVACYLAADVLLLRSFRGEPGGVMGDQVRVVTAGVLVATVPWIAVEITEVLTALADRAAGASAATFTEFAAWPLLLGLLFAGLLREVPDHRLPGLRRDQLPPLRRLVGGAFGLFAGFWLAGHAVNLGTVVGLSLAPVWTDVRDVAALATLEVRWLVLGAAMLVGFARQEALGVDDRVVRLALAAIGTLAAFALAGVTALALGPWWAAGVASTLFAAGVVAASRLTGSPGEAYLDRQRLAAYRRHLARAHGEGGDVDLERVRRRLDVSRREHDLLAAAVEAEGTPREGGRSLGRFEVVERLGAGATGTAFLVRDGDALAVLKRLHPGVEVRRSSGERSELAVARRVSHPHVLPIHDVVELDRGTAILTDYAEGGSLADRLDADGPLDPSEVAAIADQALDGLAALHREHVVHGDVKPANLLLDGSGDVLVADFGVSRTREGTREGQVAGTPGFMAPERARGEPATPANDVYGVAVTCLELLTGTRGPAALEEVDPAWRAWLEPALAEDPEDRYPDAAAMRQAMREHGLRAAR